MVFTLVELIDIMIMCASIGYIFSRYVSSFNPFKRRHNAYEIMSSRKFSKEDFYFAILLFGPAVLLHELGHKFVAMGFGYQATFFSALSLNKIVSGLPFFDFPAILMIIAIIGTYFGSQFLFFVPAYVAFSAQATPFQTLFIAFAGPFVNLLLWLIPKYLVKSEKVSHKYLSFALATSKINMWLFILNMLPIPGSDGFQVYLALFKMFF